MPKIKSCRKCGAAKWGKDPCAVCGTGVVGFVKKVKGVMCVTKAHGYHAPTLVSWSVAEGKAA